jgi:hypothetical protein
MKSDSARSVRYSDPCMSAEQNAAALHRRIEEIKAEIVALGALRPGTLSRQYNVCATPGCRFKEDPEQRHGPYYQLSPFPLFLHPVHAASLLAGVVRLRDAAGNELHTARDLSVAAITNQEVDVVRSDLVVQDAKPEPLA